MGFLCGVLGMMISRAWEKWAEYGKILLTVGKSHQAWESYLRLRPGTTSPTSRPENGGYVAELVYIYPLSVHKSVSNQACDQNSS